MPNRQQSHRQQNFDHWNQSLDPQNLKTSGSEVPHRTQLALTLTADFRLALRRLAPLKGRTILDVGGGLGLHAVHFARAGARVVIADLSPARLEKALELARSEGLGDRVTGQACAAEELPFPDGIFDRVFSKSVLIHTELETAAKELRRVLAPGGRAVFAEPRTGNPFVNLYRRTLAPAEWKDITRYFDDERLAILSKPFRASGC